MNYYKPTSLLQKIEKLVQLHWFYCLARLKRTPRVVIGRNTSVLMVVPRADRIGGYERQALQLAAAVTGRGSLAEVLTERISGKPARELSGGFVIFRVPFRMRPTRTGLFLGALMFLLRHRHRFHILHAHGVTGFSLLAIRVARQLGKPVVLKPATRGDLREIFSGKDLKRRIYQSWIRKSECLIAISEEMKDEMLSCSLAEKQIRRISNFVDTARFVPASGDRRSALRARHGISIDELVVLFLGRLEERKGVEHLLRAWQGMRGGRLWIVGGGPEEQMLKALSRDLNLSGVVFHGETAAPLDFYQSADLFVLPSLREGVPNVLLEAMSCGLPCVATRIGGVTDLIKHDSEGLLVSPGSSEALAEAMQHAAAHSADRKRWGDQAARTARERFDISRILARYMELYSELLHRP